MNRLTSLGRLSALLVAFSLMVGGWAPADAVAYHSLTGNSRTNIGSLPIPIEFGPPPTGTRLVNVSGATVRVFGPHAAGAPAGIALQPGQITFNGTGIFPVAPFNPFVWQVGTALQIQVPGHAAALAAGGRTGAATVTACPGDHVPLRGNPACATASAGDFPGRLTYTATGNQFGGPAAGAVQGTADVALGNSALVPCSYGTNTACTVAFVGANPQPTAVNGGPFRTQIVVSPSINPGNFGANVGAGGTIFSLVATLGPAGLVNDGTSFGGPNTTGALRIEQPAAAGGAETFTISGADNRITAPTSNGQGSLSLVSGAVSTRAVSGPNANRGWLNLVIGAPLGTESVPAMPMVGVALLAGLTALTGAYAVRKKNG